MGITMKKSLETVFKTIVSEGEDPYDLSDKVNNRVEKLRHDFSDFDLKSVSVTQSRHKWYAMVAYSYSKWINHPSIEGDGGDKNGG